MIKTSEMVRRLEDSIESLRLENKMLKEDTVDIRDGVIDHQNQEIAKLKEELWARVKQVEDLQSSYKTLQEENKRLKSKLEQTVDEYDEDYQTFHKIKDDDINYDKRLKQHMREVMKSRLDDMFDKWRW